jgi:hypothetical protein
MIRAAGPRNQPIGCGNAWNSIKAINEEGSSQLPIANCSIEPQSGSMLYHPHHPACQDGSDYEEAEAFGAIQGHVARGCALGNAENDGGEEGKNDRCGKVGELDVHYSFFPIAISWASTALITFSRPATMMNFVP